MTSPIANITLKNEEPKRSTMKLDKNQLMDQLAVTMRRGTISGLLGKKLPQEEKKVVKNSFNCWSDDPRYIEKLICKTVSDSQINSAMTSAQVAELAKEKGNKGYLNTKLIEWPPTRDSFKLLCKALNMEISESKILDAIICCRGANMENEPEENFSMEKLVQWFSRNIKMLKHLKYDVADKDW